MFHPLLLALLVSSVPVSQDGPRDGGGDRPLGLGFESRSPVLARHGMAATSQPLASQAALEILRKGGSAVDAAIAANAVLCLTEPTGCGLGGDLFAIVWDPASKELAGLNASGRSPAGLDLEAMRKALGERDTIPLFGPLPVSVPGTVSGWVALHERFGRLPLKELLAPAIAYAREGFPVTEVIADGWAMNVRRLQAAGDEAGDLTNYLATFTDEGRAPGHGEIFANPGLANTLERIAEQGSAGFYGGETAERIDAYCRKNGCALRKEDLAAHRAEWVTPISTVYRGVRVHELPPNGQGLAALQMLNVLEGFDVAALGHNSGPALHVLAEAKKLAFADRARFYADPEFYDPPLERLLSKEYAAAQRERIDLEHAAADVVPGLERLENGDTIYLATADESGMMVSLIQSNYVGMGSGLVPDGLGFVLQDRGALFTLEEGHPNVYAPAKRPFHTIIPGFATKDGEPWLAFGVMGGSMQPQGHVQVLLNLIDFGMNVQQAGDAARVNHTGSAQPTGEASEGVGVLHVESGIGAAARRFLVERGHRLAEGGSFGGYQAILRDPVTGVYQGASEMRKDGQVAGW